MNEGNLQDRLNILLEGDSDTPGSTTDEYLLRRALLNQGISTWEKEAQWRELFVKLADAADGDKTIVGAQADYDCPTDFLFPLGYLRVSTSTSCDYYPYKTLQSYQLIATTDTTTEFYYVTGNPQDGYTIHIHPTPSSAADGNTISYEYYKTADTLAATTTTPELSDPLFLVAYALYLLRRRKGDIVGSREALAEATARLDTMKERNAMTPWYTQTKIPDYDFVRGVGGFGV